MHELSLAMSLVEAVEETMARERLAAGGVHVRAVRLRIGTLSGVNREALAFAYECACQDTALAGSRLTAETTAGRELEVIGIEVDP